MALSGQVECDRRSLQGWAARCSSGCSWTRSWSPTASSTACSTVVLVHGSMLHLLFNMYRPVVRGPAGRAHVRLPPAAGFYVLGGISGSMASYVFGDGAFARRRLRRGLRPLRDRPGGDPVPPRGPGRPVASHRLAGRVPDRAEPRDRLRRRLRQRRQRGSRRRPAAGAWLALAIPPSQVPTLASLWQSPQAAAAVEARGTSAGRLLAMAALVAVLAAGFVTRDRPLAGRDRSTAATAGSLSPRCAPRRRQRRSARCRSRTARPGQRRPAAARTGPGASRSDSGRGTCCGGSGASDPAARA